MQTKDFKASVKAVGEGDGLDDGQFDAVVSVFGNEDSYGDVVMPGAFKDDLEQWAVKGDPMPVIWAHDWADPFSHIGYVVKAEETDAGLRVRGQLDLDNPKALQVWKLLKGRRVTQFSFAYDVEDAGWGKRDDREVYELRKLKTHEVGPCLLGVNQETELLAVKARDLASRAKAGHDLTPESHALLKAAREALGTIPEPAEPATPEIPAPSGAGETEKPSQVDDRAANDEEPPGAKSEEPPVKSAPRRALAVAHIINLTS